VADGDPLPAGLNPQRPGEGYLDAWAYLALKHPRHAATMTSPGARGPVHVAALVDPDDGSAVILTADHMRQRGPSGPALAARASAILTAWQQAGRPGLGQLRCGWRFTDPAADTPILAPTRWRFEL
jgi:hypothetical protein